MSQKVSWSSCPYILHVHEKGDYEMRLFGRNKIEKARRTMREALAADKGFKQGYLSNVAVVLMDELDVEGYEKRMEVADKILKRIFD